MIKCCCKCRKDFGEPQIQYDSHSHNPNISSISKSIVRGAKISDKNSQNNNFPLITTESFKTKNNKTKGEKYVELDNFDSNSGKIRGEFGKNYGEYSGFEGFSYGNFVSFSEINKENATGGEGGSKGNFAERNNVGEEKLMLILTVVNTLSKNEPTVIKIGELGIIDGSLRNKNDGVTYFGSLENFEEDQNFPSKAIDYKLSLKLSDSLKNDELEKEISSNKVSSRTNKEEIEEGKNDGFSQFSRKDLEGGESSNRSNENKYRKINKINSKKSNSRQNANHTSNTNDKITNKDTNISKEYLNDIKINEEEMNYLYGRFFQIKYNQNFNEYFIKDLGNGMGTFVKINRQIILSNNSLVCIGNTFMVIHLEEFEDNQMLSLKFYNKNDNSETKEFLINSGEQQSISIGRNAMNDIIINDSLMSKTHCSLKYNEYSGWSLTDGIERLITENGEEAVEIIPSTNGTWILAVDEHKIYNGMIFKSGFYVFSCSLVN